MPSSASADDRTARAAPKQVDDLLHAAFDLGGRCGAGAPPGEQRGREHDTVRDGEARGPQLREVGGLGAHH